MPFSSRRGISMPRSPRLQDVLGKEFFLSPEELQAITDTGQLRKCAVKLGISIRQRKTESRCMMIKKADIINEYKRKLLATARARVQELESTTCISKFRKRACQLGIQSRYGGRKETRYVSKKVIIEEYKKKLSALHLWPSSVESTSESSVFERNNCLSNYGFVIRPGPLHNVEDNCGSARMLSTQSASCAQERRPRLSCSHGQRERKPCSTGDVMSSSDAGVVFVCLWQR